ADFLKQMDMEQFGAQLRTIDVAIRDVMEGKGSLGTFVMSDRMYTDLLAAVEDLHRGLRSATSSTTSLGQFLYRDTLHNDMLAMFQHLDEKLAQIQSNPYMRNSARFDELDREIVKLRGILADLNAGKGSGGRMLQDEDAYVQLNRRVAAWIESVDVLNSG